MVPLKLVRSSIYLTIALGITACGSSASSDATTQAPPYATTRSQLVCPGTHLPEAQILGCPSPSEIRHGRACDVAATCPSPNLLFGECTCDGGKWTCDAPQAPQGYDPYPDCPDDGVDPGGACYLEGSTCLPSGATACFTKDVPLCKCTGHAWSCS